MSNTSRQRRLERSSSSIRELQQLQEIAVAIENLAAPNSQRQHDSSAGDSEHGEILMAINQLQLSTHQLQQQIGEIDAKFAYLCRELKREAENVQTGTTIQLEHRVQQTNDRVMNGTSNPSPIISDQRVQQPNDGVVNGTSNPSPIISDQRVQQTNDRVMNGTSNPSPIISDQRVQQPNDGVVNGTSNPSPIISDQRVQQPNDGLFAIHLKNCWDKYACHFGLKILGTDYLTIRKTDQSVHWSYVFSTCPVPIRSAGIFYFEVDIFHVLSCFTIGLATKQMPLTELAVPAHNASSAAASAPGGTAHLFGGTDHFLLMISMSINIKPTQQGSTTTTTKRTTEFLCGDIVGFGIELANGRIVVTKNGRRLELAVPAHNASSAAASAPGGTTHLFGGTDHFLLMISMSSNIKPTQQGSTTTTTKRTTEFLCGDIVGFGIELANGRIVVTKNGRRLDIADLYFSAAQPLFPFVSLRDFGATIEANFGPNFKYKP
ncbi:hypothetical protein niasHT_025499 [Heterodera trifolii]|uniref:SPRY domain-containing protein n=1 Tax=Heterodera trifolii TaxID=157864 RepID=A0ABD2J8S9_9BILA